jgi:TonB family protein
VLSISGQVRALKGVTPVLAVLLWLPACLAADCQPPSYRKGFVWEDTPSTIMMNISLSIDDFAPARLVCLAESLKQRYSDRRQISVLMFSSHAGARHFTAPFRAPDVGRSTNWGLQHHAGYLFDAGTKEDAVIIAPFGDPEPHFAFGERHSSFNTRIDLPVPVVPPCTLELSDRCLLALDRVGYPRAALQAKVSGTVTMEAAITREGKVRDVRTAGRAVRPSESENLLVKAALQNLRTWRFESGRDQIPFRIVYSYVLEASHGPVCQTGLHFELPHRVEIRGRPLEGVSEFRRRSFGGRFGTFRVSGTGHETPK